VAQGKQLGWPRIDAALEKRIQAQLRTGKGMLKVARECSVGSDTVQRIKQEMKSPFVAVAREAEIARMKLKRPPPDVRFTLSAQSVDATPASNLVRLGFRSPKSRATVH
jgi:hypothetical protein